MNLYAAYLLERRKRKLLVIPDIAFASYEINGDECYIVDIFVSKSHRRAGYGSKLGDKITEIAQAAGCKYLTGTIDVTDETHDDSLKGLIAYGFNVIRANGDVLVLKKELARG